jgi:hypothetical protein
MMPNKEAVNTLYEFSMADEKLRRLFHDRALANAETIVDAKGMVASALKTDSPAVTLGRLGGAKGGIARAAKLSPKRRSAIARKAAKARWEK